MRIASKLSEDEYDTQITPVVVRLFTSPDRALRVCLLDNLPHMIDHLSQKIVTDKIFPQMVTGFGDLAPVVREQTVKAVLVIVPKLSDRVINGELLRHLAKTANDEQPGIRTNTTICLGKIAKNLGSGSRAKVLSAAFSRALRDPFVHARNAALMSLAATADVFSGEDCANKMLPAICPSLVDKEKMIRDQANKTLNIYLDRVRKFSTSLPDTVLPAVESASAGPTRMSTPQPGNQPGNQWMGWAISSFTNKLSAVTGEMEPNSNGVKPSVDNFTTSLPPPNGSASMPHQASAPMVPRVTSQPSNAASLSPGESDAFDDGWGDLNNDNAAEAWGVTDDDTAPFPSSHSKKPSISSAAYDDGGKPDFEGWLNAQAQAKASTKKPLPKGLAKKTSSTTTSTAATTTSTTTRKPIFPNAPRNTKPVVQPKEPVPVQAADEDEDDGWGDAWG